MRKGRGTTWWGGVKFIQQVDPGEKHGVKLLMTESKWLDMGRPETITVSIHRIGV